MLIIYRKSDGAVASNSGTNSYLPEGPPFEQEVQNAINRLGGAEADYDAYRLHDINDAEIVDSVFRASSYELQFSGGEATGLKTYPRISVSTDKQQIVADGTDKAIITAEVGDASNTDDVEFFVDGESIGTTQAVNGTATLEFTAISKGAYTIEAESKTPGPTGFALKHGRSGITVEAIADA